ncbi:MAG: glutathione S-transferase family protein [Candidatus Sericytochromatia bacterium]
MLKFYSVKNGGRLTSCVGPTLWVLEETGAPYEIIEIDVNKGEHKKDFYLKINPNGKVPCIDDDGFILWESIAINKYLLNKYKPEFLGETEKEKALVDQWVMWAATDLNPTVSAIFNNAMKGVEQRDLDFMKQCKLKIMQGTIMIDKYLKDKKFFVGNKATLADIQIASFMQIHSIFHADLSMYTFFNKWYKSMMVRPALKSIEKKKLVILSYI